MPPLQEVHVVVTVDAVNDDDALNEAVNEIATEGRVGERLKCIPCTGDQCKLCILDGGWPRA